MLLYVAYVLAGGFGHRLALIPGVSVTYWPPAGVLIAALLLSRRDWWKWIVLAACAAELTCNAVWFRNPPPFALLYFAGNAGAALLAAWGILKWTDPPFRLRTLREVGVFAVFALIAPIVSATVIAVVDALIGKHPFTVVWPLVWLGDTSGLLVSAPLVFHAVQAWRERATFTRGQLIELPVLGAALIASVLLATYGGLPMFVVTLPVALWAAVRFQLPGAAVSLGVLTLAGAASAAGGAGRFAVDPADERGRMVALQVFLGVGAISTLLVAALSEQRRQALQKLREMNELLGERVGERTARMRESEARLRVFVEHAPASLAMFDRSMCYLEASRAWGLDHGLERAEDFRGRSYYDLLPRMPDWWRRVHARAMQGEVVRVEEDRVDVPGMPAWLRWEARPWHTADGDIGGIVVAMENISDRKAAEDTLRRSEERYRAIVENLTEMVCRFRMDGTILFVNDAYARMVGTRADLLVGRSLWDFIPKGGVERVQRLLDRLTPTSPTVIIENDFEPSPGVVRRTVWTNRAMVFDGGDRCTEAQATGVDITDRKNAEEIVRLHSERLEQLVEEKTSELRTSHERLRLSERMAAMGTLAAGLGHDMGNLLAPIRIRLETLKSRGLGAEAAEELRQLEASIGYLQRLSSGLRLLAVDPESGRSPKAGEATNLSAWWAEASQVLRSALPGGVELTGVMPSEDVWVAIDASALTQCVFNLVQNAGDATKARSDGHVRVWALVEGEGVIVGVTDNGTGMSPDVVRRCMEPFYTTKGRGPSPGMGMGLALVYTLVNRAGGSMDVESSPGRGSTFRLRFLRAGGSGAITRPRRRAAVEVHDPHLRAYVHAELKLMRFEVVPRTSDAEIVVTDRADFEGAGRVVRVEVGARASEVRTLLRSLVEVSGGATGGGARDDRVPE